jgi:alanine dehydrogenase
MPGAVARTSTFALTNATYPFVEALANRGLINALSIDHHLRNGLSVHKGLLTSKPVAQAQGLACSSAEDLLKV